MLSAKTMLSAKRVPKDGGSPDNVERVSLLKKGANAARAGFRMTRHTGQSGRIATEHLAPKGGVPVVVDMLRHRAMDLVQDLKERVEPVYFERLAALLALLPNLDMISDLAAFISLRTTGYEVASNCVLVIMLLNWRFIVLYASLTPQPTFRSGVRMYVPFLFLPNYVAVVSGDRVEHGALTMLYSELNVSNRLAAGAAPDGRQSGGGEHSPDDRLSTESRPTAVRYTSMKEN